MACTSQKSSFARLPSNETGKDMHDETEGVQCSCSTPVLRCGQAGESCQGVAAPVESVKPVAGMAGRQDARPEHAPREQRASYRADVDGQKKRIHRIHVKDS